MVMIFCGKLRARRRGLGDLAPGQSIRFSKSWLKRSTSKPNRAKGLEHRNESIALLLEVRSIFRSIRAFQRRWDEDGAQCGGSSLTSLIPRTCQRYSPTT